MYYLVDCRKEKPKTTFHFLFTFTFFFLSLLAQKNYSFFLSQKLNNKLNIFFLQNICFKSFLLLSLLFFLHLVSPSTFVFVHLKIMISCGKNKSQLLTNWDEGHYSKPHERAILRTSLWRILFFFYI